MSTNTKKITIYSTSWCGFCKMTAKYLHDKGIEFEEKDIEADEAAHKELMEKINNDFRGVPVTDIDGTLVLGFDRPALDAALAS